MKETEYRVPQWDAPKTLLNRVMKEVDQKESVASFFSWSPLYRYSFYIGVCIAGILAVMLSIGFDRDWNPFLLIDKIDQQFTIWNGLFMIIHSVFYNVVLQILKNPKTLLILLTICMIVLLTWAGSVSVLYQMLKERTRRYYI